MLRRIFQNKSNQTVATTKKRRRFFRLWFVLRRWYYSTALYRQLKNLNGSQRKRLRNGVGVFGGITLFVCMLLVIFTSVQPVLAQTFNISSDLIKEGTSAYGEIDLGANASSISLQEGSAGSWDSATTSGIAAFPHRVYGVTSFAYGPNDVLYSMSMFAGQCYFESYDVERTTWQTLASVPIGCGTGSVIVTDGVRYIYHIAGGGTGSFNRYDIATDTWSKLATMITQVSDTSSAVYARSVTNTEYVYLFRGASSASFWRYNISQNTWDSMAPFPTTGSVTYGISVAWDESESLYALASNSGEFKRYNIALNTWTHIGTGSGMGSTRASIDYVNGTLHGVRVHFNGEYTSAFKYTIATNTWENLASPPSPGNDRDWMLPIAYDGARYFYTLMGTEDWREIYRYDTIAETWNGTSLLPATTSTDFVHTPIFNGTDKIFYTGGQGYSSNDRIYTYDLTTKTATRTGSQFGTTTGWKGVYVGGYVYGLSRWDMNDFQRYDPVNDDWVVLATAPYNSHYGSEIIDGGDGYLYVSFGNRSNFSRYNIATNTWSGLASLPSGAFLQGGGITRIGRTIYALRGNSSGDMNRYNMDTNVWSTVAVLPGGSVNHGSFIVGDTLRYVYVGVSMRVAEPTRMYRFDTTNDSWLRLADLPAETNVEASAFYDTNNDRLYVMPGTQKGWLWSWSPGTTQFVTAGEWYSKTMDLTQVQGWTALNATITGSGTTSIYTRTSSNGKLWTNWQQTSGTSISSPAGRYVQLKILLQGTGTSTPTVSNISIDYTQEQTAPTLPSVMAVTATNAQGAQTLVSGQTYEWQHPYFSWSGAGDGANGAGVEGYYVYFGTNSSADPAVSGSYQTGTNYTVTTPMTAGEVYYMRIKVKDRLGTLSSAATYFSYRYWYISPPASILKTSSSDFSEGTNVNLDINNGTASLRKEDNGSWGTGSMSMLPDTVYGPAGEMVGDDMYVLRGADSQTFWRYNLINRNWTTLTNIPNTVRMGSALVWDKGNYIYAMVGNNRPNFYRYNIQNDAWTTITNLPANAQQGADLAYLGDNKIAIYFTGVREFYIYEAMSGTYQIRQSQNVTTSDSGSGIWHDGGNYIYAYAGNDTFWNGNSGNAREALARYDIATDSWRELAKPPMSAAYTQNNLVGDGRGNLYITGSNMNDNLDDRQTMYRYNIAADRWYEIQGLPVEMYHGTLISDEYRYIYILPSHNWGSNKIVRYDTWNNRFTPDTQGIDVWQRQAWDSHINSWNWRAGQATAVAYDGAKYIYATGEDQSNWAKLARYEIQSGETKYLPTPNFISYATDMEYLDGYLYFLRGNNSREFMRFNVVDETWSRIADTPINAYRGGVDSMIALNGKLYIALGNSNRWYSYQPDGGLGTWTLLANFPTNVLNGALVYDPVQNAFYAATGNNGTGFYRYDVAGNSWSTMAAFPAATNQGAALTISGTKIYALRGENTATTYVYDTQTNNWSAGQTAPEQISVGSGFVKISDDYALMFGGDNSPDIWRFNFPGTNRAYQGVAIHESLPMSVAGLFDYAGITAEVTLPAETSIEFFTRTSDDGISWNGWMITDQVKYYNGQVQSRVTSQPKRYTQVKTVLESFNNAATPTLGSYSLQYYFDVDPPTNPTVLDSYSDSTKTTIINNNTWYKHPQPTFDWPEPGQAGGATDGPLGSNLSGYWVYIGTDMTASPRTAGVFVPTTQHTPNLTAPGTYYVRLQAQDMTGNVDPVVYAPFIYKFDNLGPTVPSMITVTPSGFSAINNFTYDWPAAFDGHSGISGYCYRTGATSGPFAAEICQPGRSLADVSTAYRPGTNVFYLRTIDQAGNYSTSYTTVSYYYTTDPPGPPTNVRAIPPTSTENLFAFAWDLPSVYAGDPDQLIYCYSINILPSKQNTTCASDRFISAFKAATQQGTNILYIVTMDEANNVNWNNYSSANFIANTVSPGIPLNLVATDTSDRSNDRWSITLTWDRPTFEGAGVAAYILERSLDGFSFTEIGSTSAAAYVDLDVEEGTTYYYRVRAADNVDNRGGPSGTVSRTPQGNFGEPPDIIVQPTVVPGSDQANISWVTDRASTSFVYYGTSPADLSQSKGTLTPVVDHRVSLTGLLPSTNYYYRVQSFDIERSYDLEEANSQIYTFKTNEAARIFTVTTSDVTMNSAVLSWQTSVPARVRIDYGPTLEYGQSASDEAVSYNTNHVFKLTGLASGTEYQYRIMATTNTGSVIFSDNYSFTTVPRPSISNVRFQPLEDQVTTSVRVTWTTNVPTTSTVRYTGVGINQEVSLSDLVTDHSMDIHDLASSADYQFILEGRDQYGNPATSEVQNWQSSYDTREPGISDVSFSMTTIEGVNGSKAQLIVAWKTDEPASTQVNYGKASSDKLDKQSPLSAEPTTNHVVAISNLELAEIYRVQVISKDISGNIVYGSTTSVVTPDKESSVLDNVLNLIQRIFRF